MSPLLMSAADWLQLVLHFATLSLLGIGGAITTLPDMHRYLVDRQLWLSDAQFNASVALAQAAPGPNILFVALMGWHVGINAGGGHDQAVLGLDNARGAAGVHLGRNSAHRLGVDEVIAIGSRDNSTLGLRHDLARDDNDIAIAQRGSTVREFD